MTLTRPRRDGCGQDGAEERQAGGGQAESRTLVSHDSISKIFLGDVQGWLTARRGGQSVSVTGEKSEKGALTKPLEYQRLPRSSTGC